MYKKYRDMGMGNNFALREYVSASGVVQKIYQYRIWRD